MPRSSPLRHDDQGTYRQPMIPTHGVVSDWIESGSTTSWFSGIIGWFSSVTAWSSFAPCRCWDPELRFGDSASVPGLGLSLSSCGSVPKSPTVTTPGRGGWVGGKVGGCTQHIHMTSEADYTTTGVFSVTCDNVNPKVYGRTHKPQTCCWSNVSIGKSRITVRSWHFNRMVKQ